MIFTETRLSGAYVIDIEKFEDERGFFARCWDKEEFRRINLTTKFVQFDLSFNKLKGTVRGLHYQDRPYEEEKIVHCTNGRIYDVIIDLRTSSPTFKQWFSIELNSENHRMLYIPKGFAHGFQTLEDNTEILYQISEFYHRESEQGIRWNDPEFSITWPLKITLMSERDKNFQNYS